MLVNETIRSCVPLTDLLDAERLRVLPIPQSPLSDMFDASNIASIMASKSNGEDAALVNNAVDILQTVSSNRDETLDYAAHDEVTEKIKSVVKDSICGTLNFSRNVVAPAVEELVGGVAQRVEQTVFDSINRMQVIVDEIPQPLLNDRLTQMLENYREQPFLQPRLSMRGPELPAEEIMALLETGSAALDADVKYWAAAKGPAFFLNLWDSVFRQRPYELNDTVHVQTLASFMPHTVFGMENALAIYLISNRLVNSAIEGFEMSLNEYDALIADFRQAAATVLLYEIEMLDQDMNAGMLVRSFDKNTVTVNSAVYSKWISEGGDNEILFGNLLGQTVYRRVEDINEHCEELKAAWNRYASMVTITERGRKNLRIRECFSMVFRDQVGALAAEDESLQSNVENVYARFNEELRNTPDADFADLYEVALRLVCRARFPSTDAERILSGIARHGRENPSMTPREAAAVATLEYLIDWVGSQFLVEQF